MFVIAQSELVDKTDAEEDSQKCIIRSQTGASVARNNL